MTEQLSDDEVGTALDALPDWQADGGALVRKVSIPAGGTDALRTSIDQIAADFSATVDVSTDGGDVHIRVGTPGAAGVTAQDVDLAAGVDKALSGSQATGTEPGQR